MTIGQHSVDSQVILLLCAVFGEKQFVKPLTVKEYSNLANWLKTNNLRPGDLLDKNNSIEVSKCTHIDKVRLEKLLGRGVQLGISIEEWERKGIWIVSRSDSDYPIHVKQHLKSMAPPFLYGAGNRSLLDIGGLGIVGSRNVDKDGEEFSCNIANLCVENSIPVISGGARGVDNIAMTNSIESGGITIGILADTLLKKSLERISRTAISEGRLLLLSPYNPNAGFSVGSAMGRNKLIYAFADYCLVVSAEHKKGGTWAGAEEELNRKKRSKPVFVWMNENAPKGNSELLVLGANPWPKNINKKKLKETLEELSLHARTTGDFSDKNLFNYKENMENSTTTCNKSPDSNLEPTDAKTEKFHKDIPVSIPESIYEAVIPVILNNLDHSPTPEKLAKTLNVKKSQLQEWLNIAVSEKKIKKLNRPVRYLRIESTTQ